MSILEVQNVEKIYGEKDNQVTAYVIGVYKLYT